MEVTEVSDSITLRDLHDFCSRPVREGVRALDGIFPGGSPEVVTSLSSYVEVWPGSSVCCLCLQTPHPVQGELQSCLAALPPRS